MKFSTLTQSGQSLIELLMVIALLSILAVVSTNIISDTLNESRFVETKLKLLTIRKALVGDPTLTEAGVRSNFGYQGDIGGIPSAVQGLAALWSNPGLPPYAMDSSSRIGLGWNGPYLDNTSAGIDYTVDGWGNPFVYNPGANPPTVVSLGANGVAGGTGYDQDITMELPANVTTATVYGVIVKNQAPWNDTAEIYLNEPNGSGTLQTTCAPAICPPATTSSGNNGAFSFSGVPIGIRSITIYVPSKAAATQTLGPIVFSVTSNRYLIPAKMLDLGL